MSFLLYLLTSFGVSFLFGSFFSEEKKQFIIFLILIILLTPAQLSLGSTEYAPSIFAFMFNLILEQDYSLRVLRPLILSIPICLFLGFIILSIRKRFF